MKILLIAQRIPYPPNKGDKIRFFNEIKHLSDKHELFLVTHIDNPDDSQYIGDLKQLCKEVHTAAINPLLKKISSLPYLLTSTPLSIPYFYEAELQKVVDDIISREPIDAILCCSSQTAEYVFRLNANSKKLLKIFKIMDFTDLDSDKWLQYSKKSSWPLSWVYRHEAVTLLEYEKKIGNFFDISIFVSEKERDDFSKLSGLTTKVKAITNGVDTDYFSPRHEYAMPFKNARYMVFTGTMDYHANIDAVCWFAKDIFPIIRKEINNAVFVIAGSSPAKAVRDLASDRIIVTGAVSDIRPYIMAAEVVVVPTRLARGIQNKVLEGMAMSKPVVTTYQALSGISADNGVEILAAKDEQEFASHVIRLLNDGGLASKIGSSARERVRESYSWHSSMTALEEMIVGGKVAKQ